LDSPSYFSPGHTFDRISGSRLGAPSELVDLLSSIHSAIDRLTTIVLATYPKADIPTGTTLYAEITIPTETPALLETPAPLETPALLETPAPLETPAFRTPSRDLARLSGSTVPDSDSRTPLIGPLSSDESEAAFGDPLSP
jgi:hypothetical protein